MYIRQFIGLFFLLIADRCLQSSVFVFSRRTDLLLVHIVSCVYRFYDNYRIIIACSIVVAPLNGGELLIVLAPS